MTTRMAMTLSASALLLGGSMVGCTAHGGDGLASASSRSAAAQERTAAMDAAKAGKALARHDAGRAVTLAEATVELAPRVADYRVLLGQSYLQGGRFTSARQAFADALALAPDNGKAALNFALAQVATGDWQAARRTLDEHSTTIAPADRGLALALAGDPQGAVALLMQVARSPQSSPIVRQNLALSLALAGQWPAARAVAAADMSPADVDARLEQWAAFAQPHSASDQVASLLGVRPVQDAGQPVALALNTAEPSMQVAAAAVPASPIAQASEPASPALAEADVHPVIEKASAAMVAQEVPPATILSATPKVSFLPRHEVVQRLPAMVRPAFGETEARSAQASLIRAGNRPAKLALAPAPQAKGDWYVQLGAFDSAAVAKDAWSRAKRRMPVLAAHGPSGMDFSAKGASFYRLSVGGFARADAVSLCLKYRQVGGECFVRAGAGDQVANWIKRPGTVQVASR